MKKIKYHKYILISLILALAFAVRFYRLSDFPALNADEAALGYNAWSLTETGMDEHGNPWPIHLQSFNDYKPALYAYLVIPFVKFGGMETLMVRAPGAFLGVLSVLMVYLLAKEILKSDKKRETFALISALFLAISPWHIHFSRGGWEVNVATFFITLGMYLFLKSLKNPKLYFWGFLSFVVSLYTYHAARIIVPLLGLGFVVIFFEDVRRYWKRFIIYGLLAFGFLIPLAFDLMGPAGLSRAAGVGIFSDPGPLNQINEKRGEHHQLQAATPRVLHNKMVNYSLAIFENWGEHFEGEFLFLSGDDIQRNRVPEHGQMYLHDIFFVILGLVAIAKHFNKFWGLVLYWLVVSPVAAALTFQSPHALRAQNMIIPLVLISAYGLACAINWAKSNFRNQLFLTIYYLLLTTIVVWSFARYQHLYWIHMPRAYPFSSQYGFEEMIKFVENMQNEFDEVVITDRYDQPYILTLFYLRESPEKFQKDHSLTERDGYGFSTVRNFGKYNFTSIGEWSQVMSAYPNSLIVGTDEEIPDEANIIKRIYFPNGEIAFKIVAN